MPSIIKKIDLVNGDRDEIACDSSFSIENDEKLGAVSIKVITFNQDVEFREGDQMEIRTYINKLKEY